ncbi:prepilin-type N-terminal cleavage/methylation domain-containing protein [Neobacillus niacini]|uniref:type IV pilus modification PilV family protein n=1 Tax=Neobacillus driksii TaxID=3035913 RepID=UPI0027890D6B|nr:prepilin-type N-terminal cleavage/methylation domain-containing protein [Neobacillus niacini]MDQ0975659.1 prepilin-type N-terminal cleavage/methylation domain-containing protein [Neobacillus niacini]
MKFISNEKGVTLVEVIAAISLLSIVLIGIMGIFPQMGFINKHNEDKSQAINSAKQILNEWKSEDTVTGEKVISALKKETPTSIDWPIPPEVTTTSTTDTFYTFKKNDINSEIRIWKNPETGFGGENDLIKTYKILVQVKNKRDTIIGETYGYIVVKKEMTIDAD